MILFMLVTLVTLYLLNLSWMYYFYSKYSGDNKREIAILKRDLNKLCSILKNKETI